VCFSILLFFRNDGLTLLDKTDETSHFQKTRETKKTNVYLFPLFNLDILNMDEKNPKKSENSNQKIVLNILIAVLIIGFFGTLIVGSDFISQNREQPGQITELTTLVRDGQVSKITVSEDGSTLETEIYANTEQKDRGNVETKTFENTPSARQENNTLETLTQLIGEENVTFGSGDGEVQYIETPKSAWTQVIESPLTSNLLWILIIVGVGLYMLRQLGNVNQKSISFGNSRAKSYDALDGQDKVTFTDVAGNEEAKEELVEVVDFLKRPDDYVKMGAKIPHGVMLVGAPGNGKTLLAKAVAGEADVPFLYVSGSEFVEMFVGVGAGRVRDLFRQAKKQSPCVIFIDEIDAVGRQRGSGLGNTNDEREQTLNQILVEMDGFEPASSVIVIAATNRPDVLDPALLRPGRFDRQVTITAPDKKERKQILAVHAKNKKLDKSVDLDIIAKRTPGFSGADLANVLNEAAILTVRARKKKINNTILREAIEKSMLGPSLRSKVITPEARRLTAFHEAGHALAATVLPYADKVQKVTIIPRGRAGGYTFSAKDNDAIVKSRQEFLDDITVFFGGYVVEDTYFGGVTTGPSNDLKRATEIARDMVTKYGMSNLGPISLGEEKGMSFLGRDLMEGQHYSDTMAAKVDTEVQKILNECKDRCAGIITKHKKHLDAIAEALLEEEVLEYEEFMKIVQDIYVPNASSIAG